MRFRWLASQVAMVLAPFGFQPAIAQTRELTTMYIYCNYVNKNNDMFVSDVIVVSFGFAGKIFDKHLIQTNRIDPPIRSYGTYAHCVASYTPERAQSALDALVRNNSASYNIVRTGFGGDHRAETAKLFAEKNGLSTGTTSKPSMVSKPQSQPLPKLVAPTPPQAVINTDGETLAERQASERRATAIYEAQHARLAADKRRVIDENARRQANYKAQEAQRQAEYRAKLAAHAAETARIRAEWAEQVARCKAGDRKACVSKAVER